MNEAISIPALPVPAASVAPVAFTGDRGEFRSLLMRGALLELVTLGFYRFWLATDIRRHLWTHTAVDGDAPEYIGRGRELLIGFLVAMAILIPIYLVYFLIGLEAERLQAFASFPLILFLYLFGQFALYRARRYRLSRTVWRGVRFWMTGSGWAYALRGGAWAVLVIVTLGLALPWRDAALERYKMRHSHYGSLKGSFEGRGIDFFKRGWWLWLLSPTALLIIPAPFLYGAYKSIQWQWWLEGVRFGDASLLSKLKRGELIGIYWGVIGWSTLFATIFGLYMAAVVAGVMIATGSQSAPTIGFHPVVLGATVVGYLASVFTVNVVLRLYLVRGIWERVSRSASVVGLESVASVAAQGDMASALGEGFADGLDIGGL